MITLSHIREAENAVLVIPKDMHKHHKEMIKLFLEANFAHREIKIKCVDDDVAV